MTSNSTIDQGTETEVQPDGDPKRFRALAIIAVAQLMVVLDASVVIIALPSAQRALHISTANREVDADRLHAGLCRVAASRWPHRRLLRAQAHVRDQPDRLRGRLRAGRPGAERRHALQRPGPAGRLRRGDGSGRPLAVDGRLHRAQGTRPCLRRLRRHCRRRRGHRPHPRRLPDRVRLVALDTAHQRADRHRRRTGGPPRRHGEPELRPTTATTSRVRSPSPAGCWRWSTPSPRRGAMAGAPR